jgi:intracellular septation protein
MKILFDFLPVILFFGTFKYAEGKADAAARFATEHLGFLVSGGVVGTEEAPVLLATLVVILATLVQVAVQLARGKKVDMMLWVTFGLVVVLGGATIWFHNATFIKWKPSVLYWVMALAFWLSQALFGKNLLQALIGEQLELPAVVWRRLNVAWVAFFALMGVLNLYVAYSFSTATVGQLQGVRRDRVDAGLHGRPGLLPEPPPEAGARTDRSFVRPARPGGATGRATSERQRGRPRTGPVGGAAAGQPGGRDDSHRHAGHAGRARRQSLHGPDRQRSFQWPLPGGPAPPRL